MVFFSIIIPTYNRAELLRDALNSVVNQSFSDFEIIVVDDGSTDHTELIVNNYKSENLRYIGIPNSERGAARNIGIRNARGKYLVFLDSDDLFKDNHLSVLYSAIDSHPSIAFFATKYDFVTESGVTKRSDTARFKQGLYNYFELLKGNFLACNFCVRSDADHLQLFIEDRRYTALEDWIFLVTNLSKHQLYLINSVTVLMRDHKDRTMRVRSDIIERRIFATMFIENNVALSPREHIILWGYSHYFCSIHAFIHGETKLALTYLFRSSKLIGVTMKHVLLLGKILLMPWKHA